MNKFQLKSPFLPSGDQPKAIKELFDNFKKNQKEQTLLGVTGSGKTLTMAHLISQLQVPTLILAPNKTLAAQLFVEFKELFPKNSVEYFVSYYDYYQPEAYIPATNTYIEKDASINEQIDLMRHSATRSLLEKKDVIIVSSISCIYGLGSRDHYENLILPVEKNEKIERDAFLKKLIEIQYKRKDVDFERGSFRVKGDTVDIFPAYEDSYIVRVEFFGDYIDRILLMDFIDKKIIKECLRINIYPSSHYVSTKACVKKAIQTIKQELKEHILTLEKQTKWQEKTRIKERTLYDLEILSEMGSCPGIENYSRHLTGRNPGEPPPTLLEYFPKNFLTFIDESHMTVPQAGGMYQGDRRRKLTLVEHGFRLPSALDNRPLNFEEFKENLNKVVYVSATPGDYEKQQSSAIVEQIIRPTGLIDPEIELRPVKNQIDDLLEEIEKRIQKKERVLVITLTKKQSENLASYYQKLNIKCKYLHSDIKTLERTEIIRELRSGVFDVLIGINLLREGLDLPEVSLVAVLDSDQEGFLRSARALIQIVGRAARHIKGRAILYADRITPSLQYTIEETKRRRVIQKEHNRVNKIKPKTIKKGLNKSLTEIYGLGSSLDTATEIQINSKEIKAKIKDLKKQMKERADNLEFEEASRLRDRIKALELAEMESSLN